VIVLNSLEEKEYQKIFEAAVKMIEERRKIDPSFSIKDLERLLRTEYEVEGNDQFGRGRVFELELSATIAAHEFVLAKWKKESDNSHQ